MCYRVVIDTITDGSVDEKFQEKSYSGSYNDAGASSSTGETQTQASQIQPSADPDPLAKDPKQLTKEKGMATKALAKLATILFPYKTTLKHKAIRFNTRDSRRITKHESTHYQSNQRQSSNNHPISISRPPLPTPVCQHVLHSM